jgi:hypothetical protein
MKPSPALAKDDAKQRIEAAAEAAGLTPAELGSLLVDAGVTALPPSDGIIEKYTLDDLGVRLWSEAVARPKSKRAEWYKKLHRKQQQALVSILRERGYATNVIAQEFDISPLSVARIYAKFADSLGDQVVGLRLNTLAGQMMLAKERAQQLSLKKNDARTFWNIEKDYVKKLQDLGIVDRAIHRVEHTLKFDDEKKADIEAVLALQEKQRKRKEEIKKLEVEVHDAKPDDLEHVDD